jgi:hypothetical protein
MRKTLTQVADKLMGAGRISIAIAFMGWRAYYA